MLNYPVWSSPVEYIHVQCSTFFVSFIWKRAMQFGTDQSSCPVWYFPVRSRVLQCSAVWWSQAQPKTVRSSEVQCRSVQSSEVLSGSVQSGPLHWHAVQSIQWNLCPSSPVQSRPVQFQFISKLSSFPSGIAQVHISRQQSSLVQSSALQSSAICNTSAHSRPVQSRTTNCRWV